MSKRTTRYDMPDTVPGMSAPYGVSLFRDGYPEKVSEKAWRYVWSIHGRGLSTSVGIHADAWDAFTAGHRAGARSARRRDDERAKELVDVGSLHPWLRAG